MRLFTLLVCLSICLSTLVSVSECSLLLSGQETIGNVLAFAVILIHQHPDVLARYEVVHHFTDTIIIRFCCNDVRLHEEIDEVLGDKQSVSADDLDHLKYTEQVTLILQP